MFLIDQTLFSTNAMGAIAHAILSKRLNRSRNTTSAGLSSLGVPGVPWHTQILADQLTLFQSGGTDYAHLISTGTSGFSDLPTALNMHITANSIFSQFDVPWFGENKWHPSACRRARHCSGGAFIMGSSHCPFHQSMGENPINGALPSIC